MKAIKVRLYPNKTQSQLLNNHFNCCRFIYNNALNYKIIMYKDYGTSKSKFDILNELPDVKSEFAFLQNIKAEVLQNSIDNLETAYKRFFKGSGFPKFKRKSGKQSFTTKQNLKVLENSNKIVFLKQKIQFRASNQDALNIRENSIKKITFSRNASGQYFASILIDFIPLALPKVDKEVGIDLGIKSFAVMSDGCVVKSSKYYRTAEHKLSKLQKQYSRKKKGSKNKEKARLKLAKQHQKVHNQRSDFQHKLSTKLINENQVIYLETLKVCNMIKNHKLAKSIQDASWSTFVEMLKYKAVWYGRTIVQIGQYEPTSKCCSECGWKDVEQTLKDREFVCHECGIVLDRDLNAALNILKIGRSTAELAYVSKSTLVETVPLGSRRSKKSLCKGL